MMTYLTNKFIQVFLLNSYALQTAFKNQKYYYLKRYN